MYHIRAKNVNEALRLGVMLMNQPRGLRIIAPRGEKTIEYPTPVVTTYLNPTQRVLTIAERDANPFFHLFESLWILHGRQDVDWLAQFNKQMREYSDDGKTFHAAYGHRLRFNLGFDQIEALVDLLRNHPNTRRAVLQIWDGKLDLGADSKDIPCNDLIFFKLRGGVLHMTVSCRSNDMVWGAYGANAVQFSMLQEYIAGRLGCAVGRYVQVSDSFHVYVNEQWDKLRKLPVQGYDPYHRDVVPFRLFTGVSAMDAAYWETDLYNFLEYDVDRVVQNVSFKTSFFRHVAQPMLQAWRAHKLGGDGMHFVNEIMATDWRYAAAQWLSKREQWTDSKESANAAE